MSDHKRVTLNRWGRLPALPGGKNASREAGGIPSGAEGERHHLSVLSPDHVDESSVGPAPILPDISNRGNALCRRGGTR
jgi:hypothetical protein